MLSPFSKKNRSAFDLLLLLIEYPERALFRLLRFPPPFLPLLGKSDVGRKKERKLFSSETKAQTKFFFAAQKIELWAGGLYSFSHLLSASLPRPKDPNLHLFLFFPRKE